MLRSVSASSSCAPLWRARTTAARSATHVAPQTRGARAPSRGTRPHRGRSGRRAGRRSRARASARDPGWASAYRSPTYEPYEMPSSVQRVDAERAAERLHVGDDVVRPEELPPCAELPRARADGGCRRRPEVGAAHLGLQRGTVERARRRSPAGRRRRPGSRAARRRGSSGSRASAGTPGWPGPPVIRSNTPRGARTLSAVATASRSVPRLRPAWSSGTASVEHV